MHIYRPLDTNPRSPLFWLGKIRVTSGRLASPDWRDRLVRNPLQCRIHASAVSLGASDCCTSLPFFPHLLDRPTDGHFNQSVGNLCTLVLVAIADNVIMGTSLTAWSASGSFMVILAFSMLVFGPRDAFPQEDEDKDADLDIL